jgi:hypothetical protein
MRFASSRSSEDRCVNSIISWQRSLMHQVTSAREFSRCRNVQAPLATHPSCLPCTGPIWTSGVTAKHHVPRDLVATCATLTCSERKIGQPLHPACTGKAGVVDQCLSAPYLESLVEVKPQALNEKRLLRVTDGGAKNMFSRPCGFPNKSGNQLLSLPKLDQSKGVKGSAGFS